MNPEVGLRLTYIFARKPIVKISDHIWHKLGCIVIDDGKKHGIMYFDKMVDCFKYYLM